MEAYILEVIKRLEATIVGFEKKYGVSVEVQYMCDLRQAVGVLKQIIDKYK